MSTEKTTCKATKSGGLTTVEREIKIRDLQAIARKALALNGGKDIRFVKEGSASSSIDNKEQENENESADSL